jgi:DNA-binding NarL/FixJ family response regulator
MNTATEHLELGTGTGPANCHATHRLRVLVADGSPDAMSVVLSLLEFHHIVDLIGRASNFEETIQLVVNQYPDLVLIDLEMPLANLALPAIVLTARSSVKVMGMYSGVSIPLQPLDILTSVDALIHKDCLAAEFLTVVDELYNGLAVFSPLPSPQNSKQLIDRSWSGPYCRTRH